MKSGKRRLVVNIQIDEYIDRCYKCFYCEARVDGISCVHPKIEEVKDVTYCGIIPEWCPLEEE